MVELFNVAENEMRELKHPYVGSEHFFLAYLKEYPINSINYEQFKQYILEIIGSSYKESEYVLYTPILRDIKNRFNNPTEAILNIISNDDSIVYNVLLSKKINVESIYNEIKNTYL